MSVKIIIEPLAERHLAQAAQLERECFSDPWSLEGLRAELTNPNARFLAAVSGEAMAGYLGLHAVCGEGYIANLAVAPAFRRQGAAGHALDEVLLSQGRKKPSLLCPGE